MAKETKSVTKKLTTGKGEVVGFIAVTKPSTKFNKEGVYNCNILLPKEEGEHIAAMIKDIRIEQFKTYGKNTKVVDITQCVPYEVADEETGEAISDAEGRYILKTTAKAFIKDDKPTNKIQLVDSKLKPIKSIRIGEGSIVRLGVILSGYSVAGKTGVSIKLVLVQVIKLVEYSSDLSAEAFEFEEEDGFEFEEADEVEETTEDTDDEVEEEDF